MEVIDAATGEIQRAEIFVAVLGASSFIYAEATASQALADWIGAHVNALTTLGGVPRQIVSDNLKAGITKACFYEPTVNQTYADMASHYPHRNHPGTAAQSPVLLARRAEPGDPRVGGSTERSANARLGHDPPRPVSDQLQPQLAADERGGALQGVDREVAFGLQDAVHLRAAGVHLFG